MVSLMCEDNKQHTFKLHRIIACNWIHDFSDTDLEVNHKDGNKLNNHVLNLEWITHLDNIRHAYQNNLVPIMRGEKNGSCKTSEDDIRLVCAMLEFSISPSKIYRILKRADRSVSKDVIHDVKRRKTWTHINKEYEY